MGEKRPRSFYFLAAFFTAYVLFLYGPMFAIYILSFQGPEGGLTFPMNGVSLVWFGKVFSGSGIIDIGASFKRSLQLGLVVMVLTVVLSVSAGLAFRRSFRGASFLFYVAIASLIMPSIITSLGIAWNSACLTISSSRAALQVGRRRWGSLRRVLVLT